MALGRGHITHTRPEERSIYHKGPVSLKRGQFPLRGAASFQSVGPVSSLSTRERGHFIIKRDDLPTKRGHFPLQRGHFLPKRGHFPLQRGHFLPKKGHFSLQRGHFLPKRGHFPLKRGHPYPYGTSFSTVLDVSENFTF